MRVKLRASVILLLLSAAVVLWSTPEPAWAESVATFDGGDQHTCVLTTAGGVQCWGDNSYGQLGDGTTTERTNPVDVVALTGGVTAIAAGGEHTCALTMSGGVQCWGRNQWGQLGDGTGGTQDAFRAMPAAVVGLGSEVVALSAGQYQTCALTILGAVTCWGKNENGQLGDGQSCGSVVCTTPTDVAGLTGGVAAVVSGGHHTCALTTTGGAKCWGWNNTGEVGDGTTTQRNSPVDVTGLTSGVAAIAVGGRHTCALTTAGDVKCWGFNLFGELGDGSTIDRTVPVDVVGLTGTPVALDAGFFHTCAQTATGGVQCWGQNTFGQLGDGQACGSLCAAPVNVSGLSGGVSAVTTGFHHNCALTTAGVFRCWGLNFEGQIGDGTSDNIRTTPVDVVWLGPKPTPAPTATATPIPVGGIAELPDVARAPLQAGDSSGPGAAMLAGVTAGVLASAASIGGAVWYTRRRLS